MMNAADWKSSCSGKATIDGDKSSTCPAAARRASSRRARSPARTWCSRPRRTCTRARATASGSAAPPRPDSTNVSGLTFQYDPEWNNQFIIRQWNNGAECCNPIAATPFPAGMKVYGQHSIVVAAQGDTLYVTIDGVRSSSTCRACPRRSRPTACKYPAPTGTMVGLRTWGTRTSACSPEPPSARSHVTTRGAPPATAGPLVSRCGQRQNRQQVARERGESQHRHSWAMSLSSPEKTDDAAEHRPRGRDPCRSRSAPAPTPPGRRRSRLRARRTVHVVALTAITFVTAYLLWRVFATLTPAEPRARIASCCSSRRGPS